MGRRNFSNTAVKTTLSADINSTVTDFTVTGTVTGYPASNAVLTLDRGESNEERCLYTTRSGNSFTGVTRGYDGTAAASHSSGAAVEHTITAADLDEPNSLVNLADAKGDLVVATAADTWARLPVGANNLFLVSDSAQSTNVKWATQETAQPNTSLGTLGYAQTTTSQGSIAGTEVDLTGLAVTITAGTSRRIRIMGQLLPRCNQNGNAVRLKIKEGATELNENITQLGDANVNQSMGITAIVSPSAGAHTYKLTLQRIFSGTGTVTNDAAAAFPSFIVVEDIGSQ